MDEAQELMDDDHMDEPEGHCVSRRCRLCRFPIQIGEMVVAAVDGWLTPAYPYEESARYYDDKNLLLQGCRVDCAHMDGVEGQVPCYHVACRKYSSWPTTEVLRTAEYTYEPTVAEDQRRVSRSRLLLGRRLQQVYQQLPAEVCFMIVGELVCEFAAMATAHFWRAPRYDGCVHILVQLPRDIRAQYTYLDGVRYVEYLSSLPDAEGDLVLDAATSSTIDTIHALEDHIGVRQILFSSPERSQKLESLLSTPVRGAWWSNISLTNTADRFYAVSDGVKVRYIKNGMSQSIPEAYSRVMWSKPMYPAHEPVLRYWDLNTWEIDDESHYEHIFVQNAFTRRRFRTVSFDCNDPAVTGYSVCFMSGIRGIYAHRGEDLEMYHDVDMYAREGVWMHMPVDPDERISAMWIRCADNTSHSGLMFQTNKGRQVMFGYRVDGENRLDEERLWTALPGISASPFRLYSRLSYRGVDQIAVQPSEALMEDTPPQMKPWPSLPSAAPRCHHYSAVSLKNVVRMTPCSRKIQFPGGTFWVTTGIMVQYANGHRACAGEFRMDCAGESMWVDHTSSLLQLGFYAVQEEAPRWLAKVDTTRAGDDGLVIWKSLRWEGSVQWWFDTDGSCEIIHLDELRHRKGCHGLLNGFMSVATCYSRDVRRGPMFHIKIVVKPSCMADIWI